MPAELSLSLAPYLIYQTRTDNEQLKTRGVGGSRGLTRYRKYVSHLISGLVLGIGLLLLVRQVENMGFPWGLILSSLGGAVAGLMIRPLGIFLEGGMRHLGSGKKQSEPRGPQVEPSMESQGHLENEFLTQISHDLRTPVTSLSWSLRNLQDGLLGEVNPRQFEYLESMNQAVHQLDGLVAGLPEIRRTERGEVSHGT